MTRTRHLLLVAAAMGVLLAGDAWAHGGSFRGPIGGVPPGLRPPGDPEPPPPPPSDPDGPAGPVTDPEHGPVPPLTGGPDTGNETPGPKPAPTPSPTPGKGRTTRTPQLTYESWRFWWAYNNDDILNLKTHVFAEAATRVNPLHGLHLRDDNVRAVGRPTQREVQRIVIPALLRVIADPGAHEDLHGGALVALGKVGSDRFVPLFRDALWNRYRNPSGRPIDFGGQARESAVLALGMLPRLDAAGKKAVRDICLEALGDEGLRTRERTWAAVCLGLQRDAGAVDGLLAALERPYADHNIPAGILAGLGLVGDPRATAPLLQILRTRRTPGGRRVSDRVQAFAGYGLAKLGDASVLHEVVDVVRSRRTGRAVKRSAVIAAGVLGRRGTDKERDRAVAALARYVDRSGGDMSGAGFACIALARIGTPRAIDTLLEVADRGNYALRPFAALGLGTYVFYGDRAAAAKEGEPLDPELRDRITRRLARLCDKLRDAETKAAFLLARGLVKDESILPELVSIASSRSRDAMLRGYACVALGLVGKAKPDVEDALRVALLERRSADLRRDAATGLSLLHDRDTVRLLLGELERAKSFAVQGQLITAIGTIGDQSAIAPLVGLLDDRSQPVQTRALAAVGLGMLGDTREMPPLARLSKDYNYRASVPDLDELLFIL